MRRRTAILISGGGSNMRALCEAMRHSDHPAQPALVLSHIPSATGLQKAQSLGVKTIGLDHTEYADRDAFEAALHAVLVAHDIDLICLAGFMRILTSNFVSKWEGRMLNIHPSLLPKYPGLNTHARALAAGDAIAGCSVHKVIAELDAGAVLGQAIVPIAHTDDASTLAQKVLRQEHLLYPAVLQKFAQGDTSFTLIDTTA